MKWVKVVCAVSCFIGAMWSLYLLPQTDTSHEALAIGLGGIVFAILHSTFYGRD